ncbi:hypothetical protein ABIB40_004035 [Pedobacter sp. UYP30]|uniref:hypothetical protein n=1 Tax=Pedobacter sp. UYP30 TaxID=1756400 RepID=UPI003397AD23
MKKLNNILVGLAFVVGASIAVPLYMYISNSLFHKGNDAKAVIPIYMQNSEDVKVMVPERKIHDSSSLLIYKDTSYVSTLKKNGNGDLFKIRFYDINYKKYFIIKLFDYAGLKKTYFLPDVLENKDLLITVNKKDFYSANYGGKNNPVPVFTYRGITPIKYAGFNYDITPEEYEHNVTQYLQYLMPKEEFKKRFGK